MPETLRDKVIYANTLNMTYDESKTQSIKEIPNVMGKRKRQKNTKEVNYENMFTQINIMMIDMITIMNRIIAVIAQGQIWVKQIFI